jgi:hypothetical protein
MKKTTKIVGLFIATALVLGAVSSCATEEEQIVDSDGNVVIVHNHSHGFFGGFVSYFRSSDSSGSGKNTGISGVSPWGSKGSTTTTGGNTGISSGAKGGIGSSGSSIS